MTGISLNIRPTGGFREPSLRSAAPVLGPTWGKQLPTRVHSRKFAKLKDTASSWKQQLTPVQTSMVVRLFRRLERTDWG